MTKEELDEEAEEFTDSKKSFWRQGRTCIDSVKQAYIAGAEPREKRIAELERVNKRISTECHKLVETLEKKQKEIAELEKENAELKAVLYCSRETCDNCGFIDCENFQRQRKSVPCSQYISYKDRLKRLDKEFNVIANEYGKAESKLTKARDLLNEFMRISIAIDEDFDHDYSELIGETETFLKEVSE